MDFMKSLAMTSSSPSLLTQRWTTLSTFCNLRSSANRCGSVRTGRKRSSSRDSFMTSLSLKCGRAKSCSLKSVERFILHRDSFLMFILFCINKGRRGPHALITPYTWTAGFALRLCLKDVSEHGRQAGSDLRRYMGYNHI